MFNLEDAAKNLPPLQQKFDELMAKGKAHVQAREFELAMEVQTAVMAVFRDTILLVSGICNEGLRQMEEARAELEELRIRQMAVVDP